MGEELLKVIPEEPLLVSIVVVPARATARPGAKPPVTKIEEGPTVSPLPLVKVKLVSGTPTVPTFAASVIAPVPAAKVSA